jgi:EmrB/QacA subfamily drug resistance transporter
VGETFAAPPVAPNGATPPLDPRRWATLAIVVTSIFIVALDNSVLNVAIPTILRDFHTTLPSLQWVITGYALTFATFLIIGGRLGDLYGHRRIFIVGAALFGTGSLLAALSWNVPSLLVGEALIEGMGAALMMPSTLAILSNTFHGPERAAAFSAWGATAGAAVAFGPLIGGFLTTNYSWRWAFGINVIVAPLAIGGALLFMNAREQPTQRVRIDAVGAGLVAAGMFLLVFALSEGGTYGWWRPIAAVSVAGTVIWPQSMAISLIPLVFALASGLLALFVVVERRKERRAEDPLFEFSQLRHRTFRYGLATTLVLAMGQLGLVFALAVFLQDGRGLSAQTNGLWLLPLGLFIILGSQLGARLTHTIGITRVVQVGLAAETVGLVVIAWLISPTMTFFQLLPGLACFGLGLGFGSSQLTNVVLSAIDPERSGVASGANATVRQVGSALGVAVIGSVLTVQTIRHTTSQIAGSTALRPGIKAQSIARVHELGANFAVPARALPREVAALEHALVTGVTDGTRPALLFAAAVVFLGTLLSLLIPPVAMHTPISAAEITVDELAAFEPMVPDPQLLADPDGVDRDGDAVHGPSSARATPDTAPGVT